MPYLLDDRAKMVGQGGLEPPTHRVRADCSTLELLTETGGACGIRIRDLHRDRMTGTAGSPNTPILVGRFGLEPKSLALKERCSDQLS